MALTHPNSAARLHNSNDRVLSRVTPSRPYRYCSLSSQNDNPFVFCSPSVFALPTGFDDNADNSVNASGVEAVAVIAEEAAEVVEIVVLEVKLDSFGGDTVDLMVVLRLVRLSGLVELGTTAAVEATITCSFSSS